ncbi:FAD-dependent oxidoreductase [Mesorhizobium sp. M8A.F.Ca.ET.165.01.1.1]|uniref:NAD(P)/FAD-dependent oxidoreductase n=1 Tax=Mesorhizobium sp. M8A.F.Ca.ET.165.01.1.1 TaxID=2563960 RepID=UPI001093E5E2|nr:FAD-dependent oxidoreductase [Mesorhizobium sp. M8A.F.Ca.ET.165.01.1.1]TGT35761.1 pyridine nucleotide-disulfide oxidoreductase [Mesorhizobium sp. M8A.F.Ca.ET.165.01.1.1]
MNAQSAIIVGAGHSGAKAAAALRKHGWTGKITLIGDETHAPYDRPPLSKAVLLGKKTSEQCAFFPATWFGENDIGLHLDKSVGSIDRRDKRVVLTDGQDLPYGKLLLATGSAINRLTIPGAELDGVWPLRTPQHADAIARSFRSGQKVVVIGAGVIGLEVAAAAVELGCVVHVLERAPHAMGRSLPLAVSNVLISEHRRRGVDIRFGVGVTALEGRGTVSAVRLQGGEVIACDVVVYGVGVRPRTKLAEAAGLAVDNGIVANRFLQTGDPDIFACGDVCRYESRLFGGALRIENWRNAEDQADTVARNMLGQEKAFDEVPWFWSNQYDFALQVAGLPTHGEITVATTSGAARLFLSLTTDGVLRGASAIGPVRDIAGPIRKLKAAIALATTIDIGTNGRPSAAIDALLEN